ncbi:hypothetical protein BKA80DRAFT_120912 [Phyllosticta citrichinensis]
MKACSNHHTYTARSGPARRQRRSSCAQQQAGRQTTARGTNRSRHADKQMKQRALTHCTHSSGTPGTQRGLERRFTHTLVRSFVRSLARGRRTGKTGRTKGRKREKRKRFDTCGCVHARTGGSGAKNVETRRGGEMEWNETKQRRADGGGGSGRAETNFEGRRRESVDVDGHVQCNAILQSKRANERPVEGYGGRLIDDGCRQAGRQAGGWTGRKERKRGSRLMVGCAVESE